MNTKYKKSKREIDQRGRRGYDTESTGIGISATKPGGPVMEQTIRILRSPRKRIQKEYPRKVLVKGN